jgi:hypothetical protein
MSITLMPGCHARVHNFLLVPAICMPSLATPTPQIAPLSAWRPAPGLGNANSSPNHHPQCSPTAGLLARRLYTQPNLVRTAPLHPVKLGLSGRCRLGACGVLLKGTARAPATSCRCLLRPYTSARCGVLIQVRCINAPPAAQPAQPETLDLKRLRPSSGPRAAKMALANSSTARTSATARGRPGTARAAAVTGGRVRPVRAADLRPQVTQRGGIVSRAVVAPSEADREVRRGQDRGARALARCWPRRLAWAPSTGRRDGGNCREPL